MTKQYTHLILLILLAIVVFSVTILNVWPFALDDAFITFRYSRNLASGNGPVYNADQAPSEGYTTFLWMVMMAVPHLLQVDGLIFAKLVGILAMLATALVSFKLTYQMTDFLEVDGRYIPAGLVVLMLACYPSTGLHTVSAMETSLFALMLTGFLYLVTSFVDQPDGRSPAPVAIAALLLGLTRPEGNLVSVVALASLLVIIPKSRRSYLTKTILLGYVLPGAAYFLWRALYYGHLFPLPFYLKVLSGGFMAGRYDVASFGIYLVAHMGILLLIGVQKLDRRLVPALLAVGSFLIFFLFPSHLMGNWWRFLFPVVPFFLVLAGLGIGVLLDWMRALNIRYRQLFLLVAGAMVCAGMLADAREATNEGMAYWASLDAAHIPLGKQLAQCETEEDPTLAIGDAGAVPYYSGWTTIDTLGLNDSRIAVSNSHDPAYILSQKPDVLVLISSDGIDFRPKLPWELTLYEQSLDTGLSRFGVEKYADDYYLWLLGVPDSPAARCFEE